jgi:hypothetical protein
MRPVLDPALHHAHDFAVKRWTENAILIACVDI